MQRVFAFILTILSVIVWLWIIASNENLLFYHFPQDHKTHIVKMKIIHHFGVWTNPLEHTPMPLLFQEPPLYTALLFLFTHLININFVWKWILLFFIINALFFLTTLLLERSWWRAILVFTGGGVMLWYEVVEARIVELLPLFLTYLYLKLKPRAWWLKALHLTLIFYGYPYIALFLVLYEVVERKDWDIRAYALMALLTAPYVIVQLHFPHTYDFYINHINRLSEGGKAVIATLAFTTLLTALYKRWFYALMTLPPLLGVIEHYLHLPFIIPLLGKMWACTPLSFLTLVYFTTHRHYHPLILTFTLSAFLFHVWYDQPGLYDCSFMKQELLTLGNYLSPTDVVFFEYSTVHKCLVNNEAGLYYLNVTSLIPTTWEFSTVHTFSLHDWLNDNTTSYAITTHNPPHSPHVHIVARTPHLVLLKKP